MAAFPSRPEREKGRCANSTTRNPHLDERRTTCGLGGLGADLRRPVRSTAGDVNGVRLALVHFIVRSPPARAPSLCPDFEKDFAPTGGGLNVRHRFANLLEGEGRGH